MVVVDLLTIPAKGPAVDQKHHAIHCHQAKPLRPPVCVFADECAYLLILRIAALAVTGSAQNANGVSPGLIGLSGLISLAALHQTSKSIGLSHDFS